MHCPSCNAPESKVIDSRLHANGTRIRRRRSCQMCEYRFSTYETIERYMPRVIKSDGSRENFDEDKLSRGLTRALEKRRVSTSAIETCVQRIIQHVQAENDKEIRSKNIGEIVMRELRTLDAVAYVRFASVYRSFSDVTEFIGEIARLSVDRKDE